MEHVKVDTNTHLKLRPKYQLRRIPLIIQTVINDPLQHQANYQNILYFRKMRLRNCCQQRRWWYSQTTGGSRLRTKHAYNSDDIATTDRTFRQSLATRRARHHVSAVEQYTVHHSIHAHSAQVALKRLSRAFSWRTRNWRHHKWQPHHIITYECNSLSSVLTAIFQATWASRFYWS